MSTRNQSTCWFRCLLGLGAIAAWSAGSAQAGGHKHRSQLYEAVQGYMLATPTAPQEVHHHHHYHDEARPSPQSHASGQYSPSTPEKSTPQMGASPTPTIPTLGASVPVLQIPQIMAQPASMPTLGVAPVQTVSYQVPQITLGVAPVQTVSYQVPQVMLGTAPVAPQAASLTPVTVLVPAKRHCALFGCCR